MAGTLRDRDEEGRPRNARPRDAYGRPLPYGEEGVERIPDDYAPTSEQALIDAEGQLAAGRPFHAHEIFEGRWNCAPEEERELWKGLAQVCVGLTHLQRGNVSGALALLGRGSARIRPYGPPYSAVAEVAGALEERSVPAEAITAVLDALR